MGDFMASSLQVVSRFDSETILFVVVNLLYFGVAAYLWLAQGKVRGFVVFAAMWLIAVVLYEFTRTSASPFGAYRLEQYFLGVFGVMFFLQVLAELGFALHKLLRAVSR